MQARTYRPEDMVAIPPGLDARAMISLTTSLIAAAKPHKSTFSPLEAKSLKALVAGCEQLESDLQPEASDAEDAVTAKQADQRHAWMRDDRALRTIASG